MKLENLANLRQTWHDPSVLGLPFLYGARALLRNRIFEGLVFHTQPLFDFLVGAVAFWEALASFHINQDSSEFDYLQPLCENIDSRASQLNPWTGATATLFVLVAKAGSLTYQKRYRAEAYSTDQKENSRITVLLGDAKALERQLHSYVIPSNNTLNDTEDEHTPASHFQLISQSYKLMAQLELYRMFPELAHRSQYEVDHMRISSKNTYCTTFLLEFAFHILAAISSIPTSSRTKAVQQLPLVIVGSYLQYLAPDTVLCHQSHQLDFAHRERSVANINAAVAKWRVFVKDRLVLISRYVGLESAQRGHQVVERVWSEADNQMERSNLFLRPDTPQLVDWNIIMKEQSLTTLFG